MPEATDARAFEAVRQHARFADLVALTRGVALRAATARKLVWQPLAETAPASERGSLQEEDAKTDFGNAWTALERGPSTSDERALLRALWAHALAESKPASTDEEDELAARVVWLAAFTPFDATELLDRALGDAADAFWHVVGERLRRLDAGELSSPGRAEALAAAVALRASRSSAAAKEVARLAPRVSDPALAMLLAVAETPSELHGELVPPPRRLALTLLLGVTGVLFASAVIRILARLALAYRRPADVTLTDASIRIRWRTVILGRTIREHDVVLARQGLARAVREVRYARAAFYAGLLSLALGSVVGVHTFVDGVRAASPSLLFYGLGVVAAGVALDFLLASLWRSAPGRCRVVFVTRDGRSLAVAGVDTGAADRALAQLSQATVRE